MRYLETLEVIDVRNVTFFFARIFRSLEFNYGRSYAKSRVIVSFSFALLLFMRLKAFLVLTCIKRSLPGFKLFYKVDKVAEANLFISKPVSQ